LALAGVLGCTDPSDERPAFNPGALVPATGVVTVKGKPLADAVVTFLPEVGYPGVGETDEDGKFVLKTSSFRGVSSGGYKVAISYFVAADGTPLGMGARDSRVPTQAGMTAKEVLPSEYSDLGRTTLRAKVPDQGGTFKFDLDASLPAPKKDAEDPAGGPASDEREKKEKG
jgi:hypothetical protein